MDNYRDLFLMQQTYATLFSLNNKLQVQGDKYFESLTSRQFMAMIAIIHLAEDETTINNIARKLGTTKQSVKQMITIIENKGYIITMPSQKDKRAVNVKITESGKQIMMECGEKGINFFADVFKDFTTEEMEILWSLLKKLYRFDGEEQDGFEEDASLNAEEEVNDAQTIVLKEAQARALKEFERRRNHSRNERRDKNE
ncbi:winged helix DNA-binding protein [Clostridium sp. CM028]|uniref:MarR family winged helix-turn-helix transcriptional regulator n=1 Tax=Clostridium sp. CM028 TaxID=2851575 RepID=UPI001C6E8280|nr:MarR family transcriptional regulator [Clostridium sp. CM028]MBW9147792.1 winged helix DNA-binding protein [Clostridium sp. CM028]WLC61236.1 MarR family transcriptional regulator [Clostridium sp. CM028]